MEVGPRDGLQNESKNIPTEVKVEFINRLSTTGLKNVEATRLVKYKNNKIFRLKLGFFLLKNVFVDFSFVSPKWVPQMADHSDVYVKINKVSGVSYPVLVPNMRGLLTAVNNLKNAFYSTTVEFIYSLCI